ncbi:phage tail protein [Streptomyces sp. NPDC005474]|uniref:phage tail protein n=1 Tax=Streptomyces sp. NPDC005474 TaxID=3154878 RepID=UPI003451ADED
MTRSISRRLLLAGATTTALLTLSVFSGSAIASAAPAPAATAAASKPCGDPLTAQNFGLIIDNACVEFLRQVGSPLGNEITLVRGLNESRAFSDFISASVQNPGVRKNISVVFLDFQNSEVRRLNLRNARVVKLTLSGNPAVATVKLKFDQ